MNNNEYFKEKRKTRRDNIAKIKTWIKTHRSLSIIIATAAIIILVMLYWYAFGSNGFASPTPIFTPTPTITPTSSVQHTPTPTLLPTNTPTPTTINQCPNGKIPAIINGNTICIIDPFITPTPKKQSTPTLEPTPTSMATPTPTHEPTPTPFISRPQVGEIRYNMIWNGSLWIDAGSFEGYSFIQHLKGLGWVYTSGWGWHPMDFNPYPFITPTPSPTPTQPYLTFPTATPTPTLLFVTPTPTPTILQDAVVKIYNRRHSDTASCPRKNIYVGQSFVATSSYILDYIFVRMFRSSNSDYGNVRILITELDPYGVPIGEFVSTDIPSVSIPIGMPGSWVYVDINDPYINAGRTYAIIIEATQATSDGQVCWMNESISPEFLDGSCMFFNGSSWQILTNIDMAFIVYGK